MTLTIRAEHTTSWVEGGPTVPRADRGRVLHPARAGDAHLVDEDGRSLCGRDGGTWATVTRRRWQELDQYRCRTCARRLAEIDRAATSH
jgi:hypothetical protein